MPLVLDILFVLVAAIFILVGIRRGFIKSLIQSAKLILTIIATYFIGPFTAAFLKEKFIFKSVYDYFFEKFNSVYESVEGSIENFREGLVGFFDATPKFFLDLLISPEKREEILNAISDENAGTLVETISTNFANPVADVISNVLGYVLTFVLAFVLLTVAAWLLTKIADRIAFIGTANRILGGVFGAAVGIIILMIIAVIVKFLDVENAIYPDTTIVKLLGDFLA